MLLLFDVRIEFHTHSCVYHNFSSFFFGHFSLQFQIALRRFEVSRVLVIDSRSPSSNLSKSVLGKFQTVVSIVWYGSLRTVIEHSNFVQFALIQLGESGSIFKHRFFVPFYSFAHWWILEHLDWQFELIGNCIFPRLGITFSFGGILFYSGDSIFAGVILVGVYLRAYCCTMNWCKLPAIWNYFGWIIVCIQGVLLDTSKMKKSSISLLRLALSCILLVNIVSWVRCVY